MRINAIVEALRPRDIEIENHARNRQLEPADAKRELEAEAQAEAEQLSRVAPKLHAELLAAQAAQDEAEAKAEALKAEKRSIVPFISGRVLEYAKLAARLAAFRDAATLPDPAPTVELLWNAWPSNEGLARFHSDAARFAGMLALQDAAKQRIAKAESELASHAAEIRRLASDNGINLGELVSVLRAKHTDEIAPCDFTPLGLRYANEGGAHYVATK